MTGFSDWTGTVEKQTMCMHLIRMDFPAITSVVWSKITWVTIGWELLKVWINWMSPPILSPITVKIINLIAWVILPSSVWWRISKELSGLALITVGLICLIRTMRFIPIIIPMNLSKESWPLLLPDEWKKTLKEISGLQRKVVEWTISIEKQEASQSLSMI